MSISKHLRCGSLKSGNLPAVTLVDDLHRSRADLVLQMARERTQPLLLKFLRLRQRMMLRRHANCRFLVMRMWPSACIS